PARGGYEAVPAMRLRFWMTSLLLAAAPSLSAAPAAAQAMSCADARIHCVDDTPGKTQEYATVQSCATAARAGETCLVHEGRYPEFVQTWAGGTSSAPLTFKSAGTASLEGFRIRHPYVTVEGFEL